MRLGASPAAKPRARRSSAHRASACGRHGACGRFGLGAAAPGPASSTLRGRCWSRFLRRPYMRAAWPPSASGITGRLLRRQVGGALAAARDRRLRAKALPPPALGGLPRRPATSRPAKARAPVLPPKRDSPFNIPSSTGAKSPPQTPRSSAGKLTLSGCARPKRSSRPSHNATTRNGWSAAALCFFFS